MCAGGILPCGSSGIHDYVILPYTFIYKHKTYLTDNLLSAFHLRTACSDWEIFGMPHNKF